MESYQVIIIKICSRKRYSKFCFKALFYDNASTKQNAHGPWNRTEFIGEGISKTQLKILDLIPSINPKSTLMGAKHYNYIKAIN